jgi:hypothetical protein
MSDAKLSIAPPRADRPPLRANLFVAMQHTNSTLMPLFPYLHPGAMVPCGSMMRGGPEANYGQFFHHNTEDEIILNIAAKGATLSSGQVYIGSRVHGVNSFLKNEKDPSAFIVVSVTQRQRDEGTQTEAISLRCAKCHEGILFREFDTTPPPNASEDKMPFPTIPISAEAFREYNADAGLRTCRSCGHVNEPFPVASWGWDKYAEQYDTAEAGRNALAEVARTLNE